VLRYHVFGRTAYQEPLEFRGMVQAADDAAAAATALARYGREWVELVVIPERSIHWVLGPSPVEARLVEAGDG
jgi:hypothetical protein